MLIGVLEKLYLAIRQCVALGQQTLDRYRSILEEAFVHDGARAAVAELLRWIISDLTDLEGKFFFVFFFNINVY